MSTVTNKLSPSFNVRDTVVTWFVISSCMFFALTGVAKIVTLLSSGYDYEWTQMKDPVFGLPFQPMILGVGLLELVIATLCLRCSNLNGALPLIAWFSTSLIVYRLAAMLSGWQRPCGCLGTLPALAGVTETQLSVMLWWVLGFMLLGSVSLLVWKPAFNRMALALALFGIGQVPLWGTEESARKPVVDGVENDNVSKLIAFANHQIPVSRIIVEVDGREVVSFSKGKQLPQNANPFRFESCFQSNTFFTKIFGRTGSSATPVSEAVAVVGENAQGRWMVRNGLDVYWSTPPNANRKVDPMAVEHYSNWELALRPMRLGFPNLIEPMQQLNATQMLVNVYEKAAMPVRQNPFTLASLETTNASTLIVPFQIDANGRVTNLTIRHTNIGGIFQYKMAYGYGAKQSPAWLPLTIRVNTDFFQKNAKTSVKSERLYSILECAINGPPPPAGGYTPEMFRNSSKWREQVGWTNGVGFILQNQKLSPIVDAGRGMASKMPPPEHRIWFRVVAIISFLVTLGICIRMLRGKVEQQTKNIPQ